MAVHTHSCMYATWFSLNAPHNLMGDPWVYMEFHSMQSMMTIGKPTFNKGIQGALYASTLSRHIQKLFAYFLFKTLLVRDQGKGTAVNIGEFRTPMQMLIGSSVILLWTEIAHLVYFGICGISLILKCEAPRQKVIRSDTIFEIFIFWYFLSHPCPAHLSKMEKNKRCRAPGTEYRLWSLTPP